MQTVTHTDRTENITSSANTSDNGKNKKVERNLWTQVNKGYFPLLETRSLNLYLHRYNMDSG